MALAPHIACRSASPSVAARGNSGIPCHTTLSRILSLSQNRVRRSMMPFDRSGTDPQGGRHELQDRARRTQIRFARQLVSDTELPLAQISAALNFSEPAAFTRAFQSSGSISPQKWRHLDAADGRLRTRVGGHRRRAIIPPSHPPDHQASPDVVVEDAQVRPPVHCADDRRIEAELHCRTERLRPNR